MLAFFTWLMQCWPGFTVKLLFFPFPTLFLGSELLSLCVCSVPPQSRPTVCDPMDCSLPGSSVHGIFQARILEWVVISFPRGSSGPRNQTHVSCVCCIGRRIPYHCAMWEAPLSLGHPLKEGGDSYFGLHFMCLVAIYTLHRLSVFKLFAHLLHFRNGLFDIIKCERDRQFRLDA